MSVLPQELMRKISAKSHESSEQISSSDASKKRFKELMQVAPIDENPKEKGLFSLIEEEDDNDEDVREDYSSAGLISSPHPLAPALSDQDMQQAAQMAACALPSQPFIAVSVFSASAIGAQTSVQDIEALFERMASTMIVMSSSGDTETTLLLDNPQFASSVFFGSKITIREFSTAPKTFNIEIASTSAAIASLEAGKQDLMAAFQNGKFNFSVNRIDAHIQSEERPVLHRKENDDRDDQDQRGGGGQ